MATCNHAGCRNLGVDRELFFRYLALDELMSLQPQPWRQLDKRQELFPTMDIPPSPLKWKKEHVVQSKPLHGQIYKRFLDKGSDSSFSFGKLVNGSLNLTNIFVNFCQNWKRCPGILADFMGQNLGISYPPFSSSADQNEEDSSEVSSEDQTEHCLPESAEECGSKEDSSTISSSVLSLRNGAWAHSGLICGLPRKQDKKYGGFVLYTIRQPMPPPVLAKVLPDDYPNYPSSDEEQESSVSIGFSGSNNFQDLHIPVKMMEDFLKLAQENTLNNLETCGVLAGSLKGKTFRITALILPKQESTSDSCQTLNEEEILEIQEEHSLFTLGWIHTHPTQSCFMSSVDLHTHYSYQVLLPEAIAIVMAPTDKLSPCGIFRLTAPTGVALIRDCDKRGFHPHEDPKDGSPIYEYCSHVYINPKLKFDVFDLR